MIKIMVVDDEAIVIRTMQRILKEISQIVFVEFIYNE